MPGHDIIVIGASAGGVEALIQLMRSLPANLDASVFIVLHIPPYSPSHLPVILSRAGVTALHPAHNQSIEKGKVYIAPPDYHLLVKNTTILVTTGARENHHRPAIDPLFRSAAVAHGPRIRGRLDGIGGAVLDPADARDLTDRRRDCRRARTPYTREPSRDSSV